MSGARRPFLNHELSHFVAPLRTWNLARKSHQIPNQQAGHRSVPRVGRTKTCTTSDTHLAGRVGGGVARQVEGGVDDLLRVGHATQKVAPGGGGSGGLLGGDGSAGAVGPERAADDAVRADDLRRALRAGEAPSGSRPWSCRRSSRSRRSAAEPTARCPRCSRARRNGPPLAWPELVRKISQFPGSTRGPLPKAQPEPPISPTFRASGAPNELASLEARWAIA